jgi:hypothetical protein
MERKQKYVPGRKYAGKDVHPIERFGNRKPRRNAHRRLFILFTTILALVTGGFNVLPDNPVTQMFREEIAQAVPAPYLDGFNSLLISLSEPPIKSSVEMAAVVSASPIPEATESPTSPKGASPAKPRMTQTQIPTSIPLPPSPTVPPPSVTPSPEIPTIILLSPNDTTMLPSDGKITFSWTPVKGAVNYKLKIILPYNQTAVFETTETSRVQYIEAIAMEGQFQWSVTAFDVNGEIICSSEPFKFEKPRYFPPGQDPNRRTPEPIAT